MKYLPLIWGGIWRKPVRTILILVQVAVAFALFGVLQGMKSGMDRVVSDVAADVLLVRPSIQSASPAPLPAAYADRIRSIPGVKAATFMSFLPGYYQKRTQQVIVFALERNDAWKTLFPAQNLHSETVSLNDLHALQNTRIGALITAPLAKKYGWHVGDRIPITSTIMQNQGSGSWVFDVVGIEPSNEQVVTILINYDYLDLARSLNKGTVTEFVVAINDPKQAAAVSDAIDRMFANSPEETTTQPLRVGAQQALRQIGNLNFLIRSVVGAVLVALMFSIAAMMMQSVRERTAELAVMKTLGFSDLSMFLLVVVEALIVCLAAAFIGLGLATIIFHFAARFIPGLSMPGVVLAFGLFGALLISLVSVSLPGLRAAKLQVVDALARR